jgi:competence protein ComEC
MAGIIASLEIALPKINVALFFWSALAVFTVFVLIPPLSKSFRLHIFRGVVLQTVLFAGGLYIVQLKRPDNAASFYGNYLPAAELFEVRIMTPPEEKEKTIKLTVQVVSAVLQNTTHTTSGKSLLYVAKDSLSEHHFIYGDILYVRNNFKAPEYKKNPHAFDYRKYLANQGVYYTAYVRQHEIVKSDENTAKRFWKTIFAARAHFEHLIQQHVHDPDAKSVSTALLLGIRSAISDDITQAYAQTGTMHILSVSGLHVGILFFIIDWLLRFIPYFTVRHKKNKLVKAIVITVIIWFYACITGLSPSVSRSAVMFTFLIFGRIDTRYVNSYNILAASAIPLLAANPFMLTQVGFQLSYLAILGIITFQPKIIKLYTPRTPVGKYFWSLCTVSIGAQIGTAPVTIHYFHQFPNYFLLSNILAIPVSFGVLVAGLMFFSFSYFPLINFFTGWLLECTMKLLNGVVIAVDKLPGAVTKELYISTAETLIFYLVLVFLALFIYLKQQRYCIYSLVAFCILCLSVCYRKIHQTQQNSVAVYTMPHRFAICSIQGYDATFYTVDSLDEQDDDFLYHAKNDMISKSVKNYTFQTIKQINAGLQNYFMVDTLLFCLVDKPFRLPQVPLPQVDYIMVDGNPYVKMESLKFAFPRSKIILSPANNNKNLQNWKNYLDAYQIEYIDMKLSGYVLL